MRGNRITIPDGVIDLVYSPDDGGYYLHKYSFSKKKDWTSRRIYRSASDAWRSLEAGRVRWDN